MMDIKIHVMSVHVLHFHALLANWSVIHVLHFPRPHPGTYATVMILYNERYMY